MLQPRPDSVPCPRCSVAALLRDGVVMRTSNMLRPGPVKVEAASLRNSATRMAVKQHAMFQTKRRSGDR